MRVALVINATAGSMSGALTPDIIREKIAASGLTAAPEADDSAPLPARLAAAAAQPGIEALVVAGGDGTIACAASLLAGRDMPLGLLPLGTMNLLVKDLGVPLDINAAIETVRAGHSKKIDLGAVNGHVFLTSSLLGMPARMAKHREAQRGGVDLRGMARFAGGLLRHLGRYPKLDVTATIDGQERRWRFRLLAVVNNDFVERPGNLLVREPLDGGKLTVYLLEHLSLWSMARLGVGFAVGDWHRLPGLQRFPADDLVIDSRHRALRVMNDGEVRLIDAPLRYRSRPQALVVLVPPTSLETP
ncbi:diacylglycerol kinase family protein [Beijerinckia sp. L45]|uniref:diacylglycerol/lipid kinase family protein n=1 Tax=Beijerinckia sp. L45 TaxID=1641855 RepID=UPI00131AA457|nr:diacylglycerol kinase family protein [Beijerinckia sp. L45]